MFRLCIFDLSDRKLLKEGDCLKRMFLDAIPECTIDVFHPPSQDWPTITCIFEGIVNKYDALVLSGSSDSVLSGTSLSYFMPLFHIVNNCITFQFPVLGVCFGAQFLAHVAFGAGTVQKMSKPQYGFVSLVQQQKSFELLTNCPTSFVTTVCHEDGFANQNLHSACVSAAWSNYTFRVPNSKAFGIQFHPEFTAEEAELIFATTTEPKQREQAAPNMSIGVNIALNFYHICKK